MGNVKISGDVVKRLSVKQLEQLAAKIRRFLLGSVSQTGGHLASNLGVVELTLALHHVFSTPADKLIWDVGHQSYVHKIITGRASVLKQRKNNGGISGFPRRDESVHDVFNTGHSSTSISAALGFAKAMELSGNRRNKAIAVIGDGAMSGGLAFEGLNNASGAENLIVVLNDNQMSICRNVGAFSKYLNRFRTQPVYNYFKRSVDFALKSIPMIGENMADGAARFKNAVRSLVLPTTIFEELGFKYVGPIDGHNLEELTLAFKRVKRMEGPVLVHVLTKKGKGYLHAESEPVKYHAVTNFDVPSGNMQVPVVFGHKATELVSADAAFGDKICEMAMEDGGITVVNAAMTKGTGLTRFREEFPERYFDVGIAESHAVTFAAGLAAEGSTKPIVAIYSSFLQRAYDQILHDVCLQKLPVVFAVVNTGLDRSGETHHGIFDLSYLSSIPNLTILAPSSIEQLGEMMDYALELNSPVAIRYPKNLHAKSVRFRKGASVVQKGDDVSLFCVGEMLDIGLRAAQLACGVSVEVVDVGMVRPLDIATLSASATKTGRVITLEANCKQNGAGSLIAAELRGIDCVTMGFDRDNMPQFATLEDCGVDAIRVAQEIIRMNLAASKKKKKRKWA